MLYDPSEFQHLAKGNPIDWEKLATLQRQLNLLEQAGIGTRREYSIERPLGRVVQLGSPRTLANVGGLTQR